jgi:quercetin dioxygenase-like cupin family protein
MRTLAAAFTALALGTSTALAHDLERVDTVFERAIPNIPGKSLIAVVVTYAPGGRSPSHHHAGSAFVYAHVLSGAAPVQTVYSAEIGKAWWSNRDGCESTVMCRI